MKRIFLLFLILCLLLLRKYLHHFWSNCMRKKHQYTINVFDLNGMLVMSPTFKVAENFFFLNNFFDILIDSSDMSIPEALKPSLEN